MFSVKSFNINFPANTARPTAKFFSSPVIGVFFIKLMPIFTLCCSIVNSSGAYATKHIFFLSNCLKVIGVYAIFYSTKMIYLKAIGDFSSAKFIGFSVRSSNFAMLFKSPIPVNKFSYPKPARVGFLNFSPEPSGSCLFFPGPFLPRFFNFHSAEIPRISPLVKRVCDSNI